jgi:sulfatase maturation enzyme AslB (radical SAM superfamily)
VPRLRGVAVALGTGCNLRCGYCFQRHDAVRTMPWEIVRAACDLLLAGAAVEPELGFMGGEPFLELPLMRRTTEYLAGCAGPGVTPRCALTTNGTLLDDEALRFLARWQVRTVVSFDGVEPAQELRAPGTFATLDDLLGRLRRDFPGFLADRVTIATTLSSTNLAYLADSVRYLLDRGVYSLIASPVLTHDSGWNDECFEELDRQLREIARLCRDCHRRTGEVPFLPFRRQPGRRSRRRRDVPMCRIGDGHALFVDVDGTVMACGLFARSTARLETGLARRAAEAATIGHVTDDDLAGRLGERRAALRSVGLFDAKERKRSPYRACGDCPLLNECRLCPMAIASQPGSEDPDLVPPLPCAFNMLTAKHRRLVPRPRNGAPAFG